MKSFNKNSYTEKSSEFRRDWFWPVWKLWNFSRLWDGIKPYKIFAFIVSSKICQWVKVTILMEFFKYNVIFIISFSFSHISALVIQNTGEVQTRHNTHSVTRNPVHFFFYLTLHGGMTYSLCDSSCALICKWQMLYQFVDILSKHQYVCSISKLLAN